ncbi:unnamed protein product [Coccothraustes coccothraustes]
MGRDQRTGSTRDRPRRDGPGRHTEFTRDPPGRRTGFTRDRPRRDGPGRHTEFTRDQSGRRTGFTRDRRGRDGPGRRTGAIWRARAGPSRAAVPPPR